MLTSYDIDAAQKDINNVFKDHILVLIMSQETRIISFVRAARATLGWSQPDLAERSGVSVVAIARLESGSASPRLSTVSKLKETFSRAGIKVLDDQPEGGYTMVVSANAVEASGRQMGKRRLLGDEEIERQTPE